MKNSRFYKTVIRLEQTDFGNTEKYLVSTLALSGRYFSNFFEIKILCKKTLNTALDGQLNALQEFVRRIERIDFGNPEKYRELHVNV